MIDSKTSALLTLVLQKSTMNGEDVAIWMKQRAANKVVLNAAIEDGLLCSRTRFGEEFSEIQTPINSFAEVPDNLSLTPKGNAALEEYNSEKNRAEREIRNEERAERAETRAQISMIISVAALLLSLLSFILKLTA